jgi:ectoine hydroxylase-related dioxygenase (phytanoyl-CoA dioxygenase family)
VPAELARQGILPPAAQARFREDGFLVIERLLPEPAIESLRGRFEKLFRGEFDTGIFPDEWYWREGMSLPDVTRHMGNAWKSDRTIASLALSRCLGRLAARLMGWEGARLGQDTIWWKTPGAKEIALHQDDTYMSYLDPPETATCWFALDDTRKSAGTIEYVKGSHRWPLNPDIGDFHAPERDYRSPALAARAAGIADPEIVALEVPAGSCVVHAGRIWHGSGRNLSGEAMRRSIGVHLLRAGTRFRESGAGYIYGRYKRIGDTAMDESFFPITWRSDGYRTPFLEAYAADALPDPDLAEIEALAPS